MALPSVTYPSLVAAGKAQGWAEPFSPEAVHQAPPAAGYPSLYVSRTFDARTWRHVLRNVSTAEMETLRAFYETNKAGHFWWPHPSPNESGLYYHVHYFEAFVPEIDGDEDGNWMIVEVLQQMSPSTTLSP